MISENIQSVLSDIAGICRECGRRPEEITLVGVTKYAPLESVNEALRGGLTQIGENRVQDAAEKFPRLETGRPLTKRMIGHLQKNKVKTALELFDTIDSVDSYALADLVHKQAARAERVVPVLIQVNTSQEPQKFGLSPQETISFIESVGKLTGIRVEGLMTIAPLTNMEDRLVRCFEQLRELYEKVDNLFQNHPRVTMRYLSMGMSSDYRIAIREGSNMVRIGSAIFKDPGGR